MKLLAFKAPLKLLVYTAFDGEMRKTIHETLLKCIASFGQHIKGEHYLFIEFSPGDKSYGYEFIVHADGTATDPQLLPIDAKPMSANA